MAGPNRPMTINDLRKRIPGDGPNRSGGVGGAIVSSGNHGKSSSSSALNNNNNNKKEYKADPSLNPTIHHIPNLPLAGPCRTMLERVVAEFLPIVQRRGYNVKSISELCCCGDGLDFSPGTKRKRRKMSHNILGYNQTAMFGGTKSHTIHLRLRHPSSHENRLFEYEEVAGTLAHELAHCEYGPHNDLFFALMDDILDEHASLLASGITASGGKAPLPAFAGTGHVLGGGTAAGGADARLARLQATTMIGGTKLGGDNRFTQWMTPREAAVAAAMLRNRQQQLRLRGNRCCQPCTSVQSSSDSEENTPTDQDKDGDDSSDDDDEVQILETDPELAKTNPIVSRGRRGCEPKEQKPSAKKRALSNHSLNNNDDDQEDSKPRAVGPSKKKKNNEASKAAAAAKSSAKVSSRGSHGMNNDDVIDLTGTSDTEEENHHTVATVAADAAAPAVAASRWNCGRCTFLNDPTHEQCTMCLHPR